MFWNHRIVKIAEDTFDGETEVTLQFCEVHYDEVTRKPIGFTEAFIIGNTIDEMVKITERLKAATALPVLDAATDFPPDAVDEPKAELTIEDIVMVNPIPADWR